jgi:hypothetical protein
VNNTIETIFKRKKRKRRISGEKVLIFLFQVFGAMVIVWVPIVLFYEVPCMIGKTFDVDLLIVRTALRAEDKIVMKYRTKSYSVNKIFHELEEMKEFYSRI